MIIQFNIKNYKSFRDEVSLDLSATKITEHIDHIVEISNDKILKLAAIYGANASGKSNIFEAFEYMTYYVLNSFKFGGENSNSKKDSNNYRKVEPFNFDKKSVEKETTFEVFFIDNKDTNEKTYQYGFSLKHNEVVEEWLFYKSKTSREYRTIFYRKKGEEIEFNGIPKSSIENLKVALEKEVLLISLGAKLKVNKLKKIRDWFNKNEVINFGDPMEAYLSSLLIPNNFADDRLEQKKVVEYFATFDNSIKDFKVEKLPTDDKKKDDNYSIDTLHKVIDSDELTELPLRKESSGTLKMFSLYPSIYDVIKNGSTLFIDELNARLHPLLVRNIILTFINPEININNSQIIFTTHDVWQLSNELLRRDEIWLVEKDVNGISNLYSLAEFKDENGNKIRKDEVFEKNYLIGNYGAIPSLKSMSFLKGE